VSDATVLLAVPVDEGSSEFVEVEVSRSELRNLEDSGVVLAAADGRRRTAAKFSLSSAIDQAMPAVRAILSSLRDGMGAHSPDEITMQIGLQIGGEAGIIFAKGTTEATVGLTMTWRRGQGEDGSRADANLRQS
jgi:hypothetical protein